ncbi:hypothetical protein G6F65_022698 [Rhizopus arrhizus]|nr:hypothetical protein G6F65_022698 [Rhizopus arrhizus]
MTGSSLRARLTVTPGANTRWKASPHNPNASVAWLEVSPPAMPMRDSRLPAWALAATIDAASCAVPLAVAAACWAVTACGGRSVWTSTLRPLASNEAACCTCCAA